MWVSRTGADGILDDSGVKEALPRYVDVVKKKAYPKFMIADSFEYRYSRGDSTESLWGIHDAMLDGFKEVQEGTKRKPKAATRSFLALKTLIAHRVILWSREELLHVLGVPSHGRRAGACSIGNRVHGRLQHQVYPLSEL